MVEPVGNNVQTVGEIVGGALTASVLVGERRSVELEFDVDDVDDQNPEEEGLSGSSEIEIVGFEVGSGP